MFFFVSGAFPFVMFFLIFVMTKQLSDKSPEYEKKLEQKQEDFFDYVFEAIENEIFYRHDQQQEYQHDDRKESDHTQPSITYYDVEKRVGMILQQYVNAVTFTGPQADFIFTAPAILDSSVPATARFLDTLHQAQSVIPDSDDEKQQQASYTEISLMEELDRDWDNALEFARSNISTVIPYEKHDKMKSLLNTVLLNDHDSSEAQIARDKLVDILSTIEYDIPIHGDDMVYKKINLNGSSMLNHYEENPMLGRSHYRDALE